MAAYDRWKSIAVDLAKKLAGDANATIQLTESAENKLKEIYDRGDTAEYASNYLYQNHLKFD